MAHGPVHVLVSVKYLSFLSSPEQHGLLIAFSWALFEPDFALVCKDVHGFTLPSAEMQQFGKETINVWESTMNVTVWSFESSAQAISGVGDFVLSNEQRKVADLECEHAAETVVELEGSVEDMQQSVATAARDVECSQQDLEGKEEPITNVDMTIAISQQQALDGGLFGEGGDLTDVHERQLKVAMIVSCIALFLSTLFIALAVANSCSSKAER